MNLRKKGLVALSIFLLLFSAGWYANGFNNRTIHEKGLDNPDSYSIQEVENMRVPMSVPFKPREYIRIGTRTIHAD